MTDTANGDSNALLRRVLKVAGPLAILAVIALRSLFLPPSMTVEPDSIGIDRLMISGRYDEAIEETTRAIRQTPDSAWLLTARGEAYRRKGGLGHALADLNEAIRLEPKSSEALYDRCLVLHSIGNLDSALADCEASVRIKPDFNSQEATATLLLAKDDFVRAYDHLSALIATPGPAASLPGIGASLLMAPRFYRGQLSLFLYDRPAEAADDLSKAAQPALIDHATAIDFSAYLPADSAKRRISLSFQFIPDGIHMLIWNHIARVRAGQDDITEMAEQFNMLKVPIQKELIEKLSTDNTALAAERRLLASWPTAIFGLFLGKSTPDAIRAAMGSETDPDLRGRRSCEADFYLAEYKLEKGSAEEARGLFQAAADKCPKEQEEGRLAQWELKRLRS